MKDRAMLKVWATNFMAEYNKLLVTDKIRSYERIAAMMGIYLCDREGNYILDKDGNPKGSIARLRNEVTLARQLVKDTALTGKILEAAESIGKMLENGHLVDVSSINGSDFGLTDEQFISVKYLLEKSGYVVYPVFVNDYYEDHTKLYIPVMTKEDKDLNYILNHMHEIKSPSELMNIEKNNTSPHVAARLKYRHLKVKHRNMMVHTCNRLVERGFTNKEIAEIIGCSESSVRNYRRSASAK